jgi:hypothetical protein
LEFAEIRSSFAELLFKGMAIPLLGEYNTPQKKSNNIPGIVVN